MKKFYIKYNVGKAKYVVNFHDGVKKHKDGSDFYDINIYKSKKELNKFITQLLSDGYLEK